MIDHFSIKRKIIAERFKFYNRKQKHGESINDFIIELKSLASTCKFKNVTESLRDAFIMGISNTNIQNKLLDEDDDITLEKAISMANNCELTN